MFAQVIPTWRTPLGLPFFDYTVPKEIEAQIKVGQFVTIPFRNKEAFGVVGALTGKPSMPVKNIKAITAVVHPEPFIANKQLAFLQELAELYHVSPGFLIQGNLPPLQKRKLAKLHDTNYQTHNARAKQFPKPSTCTYHTNESKQKYLNDLMSKDGQTLIIVPEIADIQSLTDLLAKNYKLQATTITSDLTEKELFDRWFQIWSGEKQIIIGTRRALFLSFNNLETIIVDDEGNPGHKSWDMAPRFHAREAALHLAVHHRAQLILLSHTPSLETYYFATHGVYTAHDVLLPRVINSPLLIDMTGESRSGNKSSLSDDVAERVTHHQSGFILLFLNRRGSGGYVMCRDCGAVLRCAQCQRPLTYHQKTNSLHCHFCKRTEPMQLSCAKCHGIQMAVYGTGTEQMEKDVRTIAPPSVPVYRLDSDVKALPAITGGVGIIICTQYGWQKVPWDKITTTVFVDPDTALFIPEYRSVENLWQQLHGASYRMSANSELLIQTKHPEASLFQALTEPQKFYDTELKQRKLFGYPPYHYILKLFTGDPSASTAAETAATLHRKLALLTKNIQNCTITPPMETSPYYHEKKYWQTMLIKVPYAHYKRDIRTILRHVPDSWKVDPNPNTLLSW